MIRSVQASELERFAQAAELFASTVQLPGGFHRTAFVRNWSILMAGEDPMGRIIARFKDGQPIEAIGFLVIADLFHGVRQVQVAFWMFGARPAGLAGGALYRAFREACLTLGAARVFVSTLKTSPNAALLERLLRADGFVEAETTYRKELCHKPCHS